MATPALRCLREQLGPSTRLVGIMRPAITDVLAGTSWLDETIIWDRKSRDPQINSRSLVNRLRTQQLDCVLLLTNSLRTAWLAWRSGARRRIGYARGGRSLLLTDSLHPPRAGRRFLPISAVEYYLQLAAVLGVDPGSRRLSLATTAAHEHQADQIWHKFGIPLTAQIVTLNTGGAYGAAKDWPVAHFTELARRFVSTQPCHVLAVCGPAERAHAAEIARLAGHARIHSLADESLSIGLTKAVIRRSQLLVTTDSGPRHFGAAFDVPTVTLFGPTDPRWSHNFHVRSIDLQHHVPCGPCAKRTCPLGHHRCMTELTVDQVYRAANGLLTAAAWSHVA